MAGTCQPRKESNNLHDETPDQLDCQNTASASGGPVILCPVICGDLQTIKAAKTLQWPKAVGSVLAQSIFLDLDNRFAQPASKFSDELLHTVLQLRKSELASSPVYTPHEAGHMTSRMTHQGYSCCGSLDHPCQLMQLDIAIDSCTVPTHAWVCILSTGMVMMPCNVSKQPAAGKCLPFAHLQDCKIEICRLLPL